MRKTVAGLVLAVLLCAGSVAVQAQDAPGGSLARVSFWSVSDAAAFETGLKAHNEFHARHDDPLPIHTFEILTGPRTGQYMRTEFGRTWADFDAEEAMADEDAEDSANDFYPYITSAEPAIYKWLPELSRMPAGGIMPMAEIFIFDLKWGSERSFAETIGKIHAALSEMEDFRPYIWYRLEDGGDVPTWVVSLPSANWAGFGDDSNDKLGAILAEKYGEEEAGAIVEAMAAAVEHETQYTIAYRKDLSYLPAAGDEPGM